jgi:hypothetical protein
MAARWKIWVVIIRTRFRALPCFESIRVSKLRDLAEAGWTRSRFAGVGSARIRSAGVTANIWGGACKGDAESTTTTRIVQDFLEFTAVKEAMIIFVTNVATSRTGLQGKDVKGRFFSGREGVVITKEIGDRRTDLAENITIGGSTVCLFMASLGFDQGACRESAEWGAPNEQSMLL